ncbi:MAG: hypothetical protein AAFY98_08195 [Verrucomicrobiota bacterium]
MPERLPMLNWAERQSIPLSEGWLSESVDWSAERAGYANWEWTEDVVKALSYYLEEEYATMTISHQDLIGLIHVSIKTIGYPEIAEHATIVAPRVSIYLPEIAQESPWELAFFHRLREKLEQAAETVVRGVRLVGIRPCVKKLRGTNRWQVSCQSLNDEIVAYSRKIILEWDQPAVDLLVR